MLLRKWDKLPEQMQTPEVRKYYDILAKKQASMLLKRLFDILVSAIMLIILSPVLLGLAIAVAVDSPGGVFYRQIRVTSYGREFRIHKFRTMVANADQIGAQITVGEDPRITRVGTKLRGLRLDELPQLIDVFCGNMSFVGTRPEVPKYVAQYAPEMWATLLMPAGVTSKASIQYKDEAELLDKAENVDKAYVEQVLPGKMAYNLRSIENFSIWEELCVMFKTVVAVCVIKEKETTEVR